MNRVVGVLLVAFGGLALVGATSACDGTSGENQDRPPFEVPASSANVRENYQFDSLEKMAQVSELVIIGTVTDVRIGRTLGDDESAFQVRELTVAIETVLKGEDKLGSLVVEEEGISHGKAYSINGSRWANSGARAVFFLVQKVGEPGEPYRLANSQSRFFLYDDRVVPNATALVPFETRLSNLAPDDLIAEVREAI